MQYNTYKLDFFDMSNYIISHQQNFFRIMLKPDNYGEIIKKRRRFLKLTQEELAEAANVSLRSIKAIESGEGNPTIQQISKILETLGMRLKIEIR